MATSNKFTLSVIGAGGTGGYFLKEFSRYLQGDKEKQIVHMEIIDGDTVEEKNILRQSFQLEDVGFNKAIVMADILKSAFNADFTPKAEFLNDETQLYYSQTSVPIIIGCVDNHKARLVCEEFFNSHDTCFYLDSANEFSYGEVVFAYKIDGKVLSPVRSHYFPKIKTDAGKARTEMSCEELNNVAPQHIATNMQAGNILLNEVCSILEGRPHCGMVTFDLENYAQDFIRYVPTAKDIEAAKLLDAKEEAAA